MMNPELVVTAKNTLYGGKEKRKTFVFDFEMECLRKHYT